MPSTDRKVLKKIHKSNKLTQYNEAVVKAFMPGEEEEYVRMKRTIYIIIGCFSVVLVIIGIFVPGLPTTPFLLLSSWLFYNSSKRLHDALHRSKWLGPYLRRFQERKGVGWKTKAVSIVCRWTMISISAFVVFENWHVRLLLLGLGVIGTCSVLCIVPNSKREREDSRDNYI